MDIFAIDSASVNSNLQNIPVEDSFDQIPEVNFDAGQEFNLNFFDSPDDSNTQGGYSDPGSVESASVGSPPPVKHFGGTGNNFGNERSPTFQICQPPVLAHVKCGKFTRPFDT